MAAELPDPGSEFGGRVARRLREEAVAWLTVVDGHGRPQPAPIWFVWDGESAVIYSDGRAKRLRHLRARPDAALHLDSNGQGGDIVVLTGTVADAPDVPAVPDNPDYLAKYGDRIANGPFGSPEVFAQTFSAPLRFRPAHVRGY
jgi:PPOX class probable F420-dependent enzyme